MRMTVFAMLVALVFADRSRAEVKTEMVDVQSVIKGEASPTPVKLELKDVTLEEALAAFEKAARCKVQFGGSDRSRAGGPRIVYDLVLNAVSNDDAADQLAKALKISLISTQGGYPVAPPGMPIGYRPVISTRDMYAGPSEDAPVRIESIQYARALGANNISIRPGVHQIRMIARLGDLITVGRPTLKIKTFIDEHDQPLEWVPPLYSSPMRAEPKSEAKAFMMLDFKTPAESRRIKQLEGVIEFPMVKTFERITITDLDRDSHTIACEGGELEFAPLAKVGRRIGMVVVAPGLKEGQTDPLHSLTQSEHSYALTADGRPMRVISAFFSGNADRRRITLLFDLARRPQDPPVMQNDDLKPAKIIWLRPGETDVAELPFKLVDAPIP